MRLLPKKAPPLEGECYGLSEADVSACRALWLEGLRDSPDACTFGPQDEKDMQEEHFRLLLSRHLTFGYREEGALLGMVALYIEKKEKIRHKAYLGPLYVTRAARGRGIGRLLLAQAVHAAPEGVEQLHLGVAASNKAAVALYAAAGFRTYGREPNSLKCYGRYVDELLMVKKL